MSVTLYNSLFTKGFFSCTIQFMLDYNGWHELLVLYRFFLDRSVGVVT